MDEPLLEVNVLPAEGPQFTQPQAGERCDAEQGCVLIGSRSSSEGLDSGRVEDREVAGAAERLTIDERRRVRPQPVDAHRPTEDSVEDHEPLVDRPGRQLSLLDESGTVRVDALGRNCF
ncbi:MAG TPA: hypothetical protein VGF55_11550, partial [Gemmataceae bacterium]